MREFPANDDVLVFDDRTHYVACFGEDGWWRWPAEAHGWDMRRAMPEPSTEWLLDLVELPAFNAALALRLSGVDA